MFSKGCCFPSLFLGATGNHKEKCAALNVNNIDRYACTCCICIYAYAHIHPCVFIYWKMSLFLCFHTHVVFFSYFAAHRSLRFFSLSWIAARTVRWFLLESTIALLSFLLIFFINLKCAENVPTTPRGGVVKYRLHRENTSEPPVLLCIGNIDIYSYSLSCWNVLGTIISVIAVRRKNVCSPKIHF